MFANVSQHLRTLSPRDKTTNKSKSLRKLKTVRSIISSSRTYQKYPSDTNRRRVCKIEFGAILRLLIFFSPGSCGHVVRARPAVGEYVISVRTLGRFLWKYENGKTHNIRSRHIDYGSFVERTENAGVDTPPNGSPMKCVAFPVPHERHVG